ncbi:extracellular solute-binding protein [Symbioplanes lichenis]|uniref:extracellular solute-binding protein n=1 Tax=Symbioplanes lichenis TaxID=1629072 RepID=UPI00273A35A7|nr:extracellular solute-binding protein [Actinoplanes lichenis]
MRGKPWWLFAIGNVTGAALVAALFLWGPFVAEPELEPGELVVLSGADDSSGGQRQALIELWNKSHPRNQARIEPIPRVADEQLIEMMARAQDTETDIFNLDSTWTALFAHPPSGRPLIRPIDAGRLAVPPERSFMKKPLETCVYDGKLWALPFNTDAGLLYYRADQGLKGPFTWADIKPRPGFEAAYTGQLGDYEGLTVNILEAVWAEGGDLTIDEGGTVTLDLAKWDAAVERLKPGPVVLRDSTTFEETGSRTAFADGRVLFMRNWPVAYRAMQSSDSPVPFAVDRLPGPSVLGGQNLAVSERSEQPRAAQALIEFLTSEPSQRTLFDPGGFAATRARVYEDETIKKRFPYAETLRAAVDSARLRPVSPYYVDFSEVLHTEVAKVLTGQAPQLPRNLAAQLSSALRGR